jgi:hypothetical protein
MIFKPDSKVGQAVKNITESTPVSIALVLALCAGAYWTGGELTDLKSRVSNAEAIGKDNRELLNQLTEISVDNKHRIDIFVERMLMDDRRELHDTDLLNSFQRRITALESRSSGS